MGKELAKTIQVNGDTYNVNAVQAEVADKVANKLVLKKTTLTGEVAKDPLVDFDGSAVATDDIILVPASGGSFTGRVNIVDYTNKTLDPKALLNNGDIKKFIVSELKNNSVLYTWNGSSLIGGGDSTSIQSISIVTGADANVRAFAQDNQANFNKYLEEMKTDNKSTTKFLSAFIYVSTDEGNRGNIYFGTCDSDKEAGVQVSAENAINAQNALKIVNEKDTSKYFDYNKLAQINDEIYANTSTGTKAGILQTLTAQVDQGRELVTWKNGVIDGTTKVKKAELADSATSATSATNDSSGKQININYYRSVDNKQINTIKIDQSANYPDGPNGKNGVGTATGNNGDILILY